MLTKLRPYFFALALLAVACGLRWPGLGKQVWNLDEGSTFTMAEIVRDGGVMYRDAADNRTPLVPYVKAAILAVVGDWNLRGAHIVVALMLGLTAVALWRLARQAGEERTGAWAAGFFTLISFIMLGPVDAMAAHTGWFLVFFSTLAFWAVITALNRESRPLAFAAGTGFALAALAKQPGLLDWGVALVLVVLAVFQEPQRRRGLAILAALLAAGFLLTLAATYLYFARHGAWDDFLQYSWYYNTRLYVPEVPFRERLGAIRTPFALARENVPFVFVLGLLAAVGLLGATLPTLRRRAAKFEVLPWLILGWLASGLISTVLSGRDFAHYSIQVMPALSLASGWVMARLWPLTGAWLRRGWPARGWLLRAALGAGVASLVVGGVRRSSSFDLSDGISQEIGAVIKARTQPTDRIFVWGYEPELHVFAERLPNTRFIYAVFLTGMIPWTNLDALKNTDYAIVPGAWDAFWSDFTRRPPEIIVDTKGNRGFLKYPLSQQKRLWALLERDYVEVAADFAISRGYNLYQRAQVAPPTDLSALPTDETFTLKVPEQAAPGTLLVEVASPATARDLDLYLDGRPYRRVPSSGNVTGPTRFFVLGADLPEGSHRLQVVARGTRDIASRPATVVIAPDTRAAGPVAGPPLRFNGEDHPPLEAYELNGRPMVWREDLQTWDAHAPSRVVYERPAGVTQLDFEFGISAPAYDRSHPQVTDGVDVTAYFEDDAGHSTQLYRRFVNPAAVGADRGTLKGHLNLPGLTGGRIVLLITPGPMNIAAFDWAYWRRVEGSTLLFSLKFLGQLVVPVELDAPFGVSQMEYRHRPVQLIHAPSHFAFRQQPGMVELTGDFGLLDTAWQGPRQTNGATFEVTQIAPNGQVATLFTQTLYPANKPEDRGFHPLKLTLPYVAGSLIRVATRPANPNDNSFNYTFWSDLRLAAFDAKIEFDGQAVHSSSALGENGMTYLPLEAATVLFAHAPSTLTFPAAPTARHLTGSMGLMPGAYTGDGDTDGVVFVVESVAKSGARRELLRRHLNPRAVEADRGSVPFSIDLPEGGDGQLVLRTEPAPSGRLNFAWSYWGELNLSR